MLKHFHDIDKTVQGIGVLVNSQRPFVQFMIHNWPLALIGSVALYGKLMKRREKKELTAYTALEDAGIILSPLVGLAMLNQLAHQHVAGNPAGVPQAPPVQQ